MTIGKIKALGEIALRVDDLDSMQAFYQDVIGLELMRRFPDAAFFKIADGYGGHTQILALFDRSSQRRGWSVIPPLSPRLVRRVRSVRHPRRRESVQAASAISAVQ